MNDKLYIRTIIRDDGKRLEIDENEIYLASENTFLTRPSPNTTAVDYTDTDGGEMIRQKQPPWEQLINGLIIPKQSTYWQLETKLSQFFQTNHNYKIIYRQKNRKLFSVGWAWISVGLQVPPNAQESYSNWSITMTIGNPSRVEYAEDNQGNETYANSKKLPLLARAQGGEVWDEIGGVWDDIGEFWDGGIGGVQDVYIDSISIIYPIWTVKGECVNPSLQNNTTDSLATYNGTVAAGQTLVVDFASGVAKLDGATVSRQVTGQVSCQPGDNVMGFNSDGGNTEESLIEWNNVIG